MKIARLCIENLRGIERLELDLTAPDGQPRRRLVLLGGNGTGKTTTLAAIAHVLGRENPDFGAGRLGAGDVRQVGHPPAAPAAELPRGRIALDVVLSADEREMHAWYQGDMPKERGTLEDTLGSRIRPDPRIPVEQQIDLFAATRYPPSQGQFVDGRRSSISRSRSSEVFSIRAAIAARRHPPAVFLPADRGTLNEAEQLLISELNEFAPLSRCLSHSRERFQLVPSLLALARAAPERNDRDGTVTRMWKVLAKYFPEMPQPVGVHGLRLLFETPAGTVVDLPRLSDGQRAVLLILGDLALRNPAAGIVLIDEIEQHLHPRWQRAILDALVALLPDTQFIITTQAPYVAASAPDDIVTIGDWNRDGPQ